MEANNFDTRSDSSARTNSPLLSSNEELKTITIDEMLIAQGDEKDFYKEALMYFKNSDLKQYREQVNWVPKEPTPNCASCFCTCFRPHVPLSDELVNDVYTNLAIAKIPMNHEDEMHKKIFAEIYTRITDKPLESTIGNHWEDVGFLGADPNTELRGMGMLGAIMLLYIVTEHQDFVKEMYTYSKHPKYHFPLCMTLLHLAGASCQLLKDGHINALCNSTNSIDAPLHVIYVALCREFFRIWKKGKYTEMQFHSILENMIERSKYKWKSLVKRSKKTAEKEKKSRSKPKND